MRQCSRVSPDAYARRMQARRMQTWVYEENIRPLLEATAQASGYDFDDLDWAAVESALPNTDGDADHWFDYPLAGERAVHVGMARDPGASVVLVRVDADDATISALGPVVTLLQRYGLHSR